MIATVAATWSGVYVFGNTYSSAGVNKFKLFGATQQKKSLQNGF